MVDGDLSTAWNSAADDEHPWFEVTLPEDAELTELGMTVGYTSGQLFVRNRRITEVRILRTGVGLARHRLDLANREIQVLPVTGPGGLYRVEIIGIEPGTEASWTEVCISELRVLGRAPGAIPNSVPGPSLWVGLQRID